MVTVIFIFFLSIYVEAREWGLMIKISLYHCNLIVEKSKEMTGAQEVRVL